MSIFTKTFLFFTFCATVFFTACSSDDITGGLNKLEGFSYLHNESGKKVTLTFHKYENDPTSWTLEPGETLEIADTYRWSMTNVPVGGKVVFEFDDGTTVEHTSEYGDGSSTDYHVEFEFFPRENNILDYNDIAVTEDDRGSWKRTAMKGNKVRYDYYIK